MELAKAWYIKYNSDAFALGPYRYGQPVSKQHVLDEAEEQFGNEPDEIWSSGEVTVTIKVPPKGSRSIIALDDK